MKTLIVLCSLATITIAVPTLRENIDTIDSSLEYVADSKIREKKSPLYDISEERTLEEGGENTQTRHSHKTEVERPSSGKTKVGFRKPIIIKKKFGYQVFRDSDEEMAHADPNEKCRKQFKVKLCDNELLLHTRSNNVKNLLSERSHEIISDKDIGNSLKMAKAAVENLERSLQKKEHNLPRKSNSKEESESDISLHQDIEMAKSALEHIQKNMGNLESIEVQLNDAEIKEIQHLKSINQWKEAIDTIHKNVETPKNIEDAFKLEKQNLHHLENINVPKMNENERLDVQSKDTPQISVPNAKTVHEHNIEHEFNSKSKISSTKDEQDINEENDMFVSPTDHKESKMKLHSESLTSENVFDEKSSFDFGTKLLNLNTNDHVQTMKNSEILAEDSDFKNMKMANSDMHEPGTKTAETITMQMQQNDENNMESGLQTEDYNLNTLAKNSHINSLSLDAKSTENDESYKLTKDSHIENAMSNDQCNEGKHIHDPVVKSNEVIMDQTNAETKTVVNERHSIESETDPTKQTEQRNTEHPTHKSLDTDHLPPKMTLLREKEANDEEKDAKLAIDNNSLHQKHFESLPRVNGIDEGERDLTKAVNSHLSEANMLSLSAVNPQEEHITNEFSPLRLTEDRNMDHLHKENHEHTSSLMNKDSNIDEQLNDFHKSFMRLAQEKQLNDILSQQLNTVSESNIGHKVSQKTKTNEFRNEYIPMEFMNARMHQSDNRGQQLNGNHGSRDLFSMPLAPSMRPIDYSTHHFKSNTEFHDNEHQLPTSMRLIEGQNVENMGDELTESQSLNHPQLAERWAQEIQQQDPYALKTVSEFRNDMLLPVTKNNGFHSGQHTDKEQMNMRITEDKNLRQLFADSHDPHDPHSMRWAQEKQNNEDLAQIFDTEGEFHYEPHMNDHLHALHYPSVSNNRFNNNFDLDSNHDWSSMRSTMPDHFHIMNHAKSNDMDSAMQPSMHFPMRDSAIQIGHHHHHHGLARSSYAPSPNNVGAVSDAVSVFPNANTGCGIPLLLSCSPSVVSGSLTRAQPVGMSAPAYRGADNLMYYMKRDANKVEGKQNVKIQKTPISSTN